MSSNRHGAPLMAYSLSPERKSVRVMVTSARSIGSLPDELSMVSETSARPELRARGGPGEDDVLHLRRAQRARSLGARAPRSRRRPRWTCHSRSGPTTTVMPGSNSSTVGSAKDLKPFMLSDFRNIGATLPAAYGRACGAQHLAVLAEEGRAAARLHPHDGVATAPAGLALAVVDLVRPWKSPSSPKRSRYCSSASEEPRCLMASASVSTMAR